MIGKILPLFMMLFFVPLVGCNASNGGDETTSDDAAMEDDTSTGDDSNSNDDTTIGDDTGSIEDDTGFDDTEIDDDTLFPLPPNIDLYGIVSWDQQLGPDLPYLFSCGVQHYYQNNSGIIAQWVECQLSDIWGGRQDDIYVVGNGIIESLSNTVYNRFIAHFNGHKWTVTRYPDTYAWLNGVYGTSSSDVYAIGYPYSIYHYDGSAWNNEISGGEPSYTLTAVWASPSGLAVAVGYDDNGYLIVTKENGVWTETNIASPYRLITVWGAPDDIIFTTDGNNFLRYSNGLWEQLNTTSLENIYIVKIDGTSSTDFYAIGVFGYNTKYLIHYDGTSWTKIIIPDVDYPFVKHLSGLWVAGPNSVFVSLFISDTTSGRLLYYDGNAWHSISETYGPSALWGFVNP